MRRLLDAIWRWLHDPRYLGFFGIRVPLDEAPSRWSPWADNLISEHDQHAANENMLLAGDLPYYPACDGHLVGDGHRHGSPDWPFRVGYTPVPEDEEWK